MMAEQKIPLELPKEKISRMAVGIILLLVFVLSTHFLDLNVATFVSRLENFPRIAGLFMRLNPEAFRPGIEQLILSVALGVCGLAIGGGVSFILAFLGADNLAPHPLFSVIIKGFVSLIRAIPNLVLILMIVASMGMGNTAGVLGLTLSSIGFLTRAFISTIEDQDTAIIETLQATGASKVQIIIHGFFPNVLPAFLAWISIRMESSVAESISLGVIGVGGIGMLVSRSIRQHDHPTVSTLIVIIFTAMFILEMSLNRVKKNRT
ncbi:MAG: ABC transporter permease subunit [Turicibacter sp.]|nr:ABC transporter permease subunit [Turicibacter sp.]